MLKNEYDYLIHLIYCALHNEQPLEKPNNILFEKVFEIAKEHEVANITFVSVEKLNNKPNQELYKKWKIQYAFSIQRNAYQMQAREKVVNALNQNGIRSVELQGTVIKKLYPYDFWRNMSDIDFVVDKQNLLKAEKVIKELGFKTKCCGDYEIAAFASPQIVLELHSDFFDPNTEFYTKMTDPFKKAKISPDGVSYNAEESEIFVYNILHCIKHFRGSGAGIRRILDIYYLNNFLLQNLDQADIFDFLQSVNCKQDYDNLSAIADEWFAKNEAKCALENIKNKILMSGTHGNFGIRLENEYEEEKNKNAFKIKKIIKLLFPAKSNIYSAYSFCSKYKLPTFLCWIYRWCCFIFVGNKRKRAVKNIKNIKNFKYNNRTTDQN